MEAYGKRKREELLLHSFDKKLRISNVNPTVKVIDEPTEVENRIINGILQERIRKKDEDEEYKRHLLIQLLEKDKKISSLETKMMDITLHFQKMEKQMNQLQLEIDQIKEEKRLADEYYYQSVLN